MGLPVRFRVIAHRTNLKGLRDATAILRRNLRVGLHAVGKRFVVSSRSRMREDTGQAKKSLQIIVGGDKGLDLGVLVFSDVLQASIDAHGLPAGIFPPYREGTRLYSWAQRKVRRLVSAKVKTDDEAPKATKAQLPAIRRRMKRLRGVVSVRNVTKGKGPRFAKFRRRKNPHGRRLAFKAARAIYQKGIRATHWNRKALEANRNAIIREITNSIHRAVMEMRRK